MTNYHQNPASILAKLIYHGVATESPERLSPEWRTGGACPEPNLCVAKGWRGELPDFLQGGSK